MTFQHFILTRFNVPFSEKWQDVARRPGWLEERFGLFEQVCLPSVSAQQCRNFSWLIYMDESTPAEFRARMQAHEAASGQLAVIWTSNREMDVKSDIGARLDAGSLVMTTRLDNDDALHERFVEELQSAANLSVQSGTVPVVLNFTHGLGYRYSDGRVYRHSDRVNAFTSLLESQEDLRTIWAVPHPQLARIGPVKQIAGSPRWLQGLHNRNLSNRVKGRRVSRVFLAGFALDDTTAERERESTAGILLENLLFYWLVWLRERLLMIVKLLLGRAGS